MSKGNFVIYCKDPEKVISSGFVRGELSSIDALLIIRPGVDLVAIAQKLADYVNGESTEETRESVH